MMKINELNKPKEISDFRQMATADTGQTRDTLTNFMKKYGFDRIGSGFSAQVFEHPKYENDIFKIFHNDPANMNWLKYSKSHERNPFLPKIKTVPIKISKNFFFVRMEKLSFKEDSIQTVYKQFFNLLKFYDFSMDKIKHEILTDFRWNKEDKKTFMSLINNEQFMEAFSYAKSIPNAVIDLHEDNFMWRNHQLVLIDPVA